MDTVMSIDEAIESGDPEKIAQALNAIDPEQDVNTAEETAAEDEFFDSDEKEPEKPTEADDESEEDASSGDVIKVLKSKNGKHEIPYSVLEQERREKEAMRERLQEAERERDELSQRIAQNEAALNNVTSRLESQGMDVDELLSNPDEITEKQLQEIEEDYGVLGKAFRQLLKSQAALNGQAQASITQQSQATQNINPVVAAIEANGDLSAWQKGDPDRFAEATRIDTELRADPAWQGKSLDERFAEVVKLTKKSFGDDVQRRAQQIIDKSTKPAPDSLSDIGHAPTVSKSLRESLIELDPSEIEHRLANASKAERDAILNAGF